MTKRLIEIDDELLSAAQAAAGQRTTTGTVTTALERLVAEQRRSEGELRQRWDEMGGALADLQDDDVMRRVWS